MKWSGKVPPPFPPSFLPPPLLHVLWAAYRSTRAAEPRHLLLWLLSHEFESLLIFVVINNMEVNAERGISTRWRPPTGSYLGLLTTKNRQNVPDIVNLPTNRR